jgi:hypothetical protein
VVKYKTEAGVLRYTIRPLDVELSFDKVCASRMHTARLNPSPRG